MTLLELEESVKNSRPCHDGAALLAAIVKSSDAIVSKSLTSVIRTSNKAAERLFGHTAAERMEIN